MMARELLVEFYDPAQDELSQWQYDDTHRPRLTLYHLHNLRNSKDAERVDKAAHLEFVPTMYNQPADDSGGL